MLSAVEYAHALLRQRLRPGDWAVDATAGNGHDTHVLVQLTGPTGQVFAFDVQAPAIAATQARLDGHGIPGHSYHLINACHGSFGAHLPREAPGRIAAVIFNLGYLPGGDKSVITRSETTLPAVQNALALLRPGGLLLLVLYPGHPGGAEESLVLREFASGLPSSSWQVTEYRTLNARRPPPCVLAVEKAGPGVR